MVKKLPYFVVGLLLICMAGIANAQNPVTFKVQMGVQEQLGNFDPANDTVVVRGSFNGWAGSDNILTDPDEDDVYECVVDFGDELVGTKIYYKFVIIYGDGSDDNWEGIADNREYTILDSAQELDVVYFANQAAPANVTFQADMSDLFNANIFDPAQDTIFVLGGMNGWARVDPMEPDFFDPSLYIYTTLVYGEVGANIEFKHRAWPNEHFIDDGWEQHPNYSFTFTGDPLELDPIKPQLVPAGAPLAQDVNVQFSVDVNFAVDWYNKQAFQNIQSVWVTGDFNNWGGAWGVADTATLIRMYDDGARGGDDTAGDGVWTATHLFPAAETNVVLYKYAIFADGVDTLNAGFESLDNEAGTGMNHILVIDDASPLFAIPTDFFGSQWGPTGVEPEGRDIVPVAYRLHQNFPNPFNPITQITYDLPNAADVTITIYNLMGQEIAKLINSKQDAGTHQIMWNGLDQFGRQVTSGVYFYRLQTADYVATRKMMFLK